MNIDTALANLIQSSYDTCIKPFVKCLHRHIDTINLIAIMSFSLFAISMSPPLFLIGGLAGILFGMHESATIKTIHDLFVDSLFNKKMSVLAFATGVAVLAFEPTLISPITGWVAGHSLTTYQH